jgi:hypothetical protein
MTYLLDRDQEQQRIQDEAIEEIYLSGITDAADGCFPQMSEVVYLQGYCQGMRDYPRREVKLPVINAQVSESPLLCGQCNFLSNGRCTIKGLTRNANNFACDRINIDCPF